MHTATKSARSPVSVTFGTQRSTLITRPPLGWDACFCMAIVTETARDLAAVGNTDVKPGASTCSVSMTSLLSANPTVNKEENNDLYIVT